VKRPGEKGGPPEGNAERRRRQFEESRGLSERRALPLDEEGPADGQADEQRIPEPSVEDEEPRGAEEPPRDEND
jgi:hypothetical protein